jgi:hypothetical protein
MITGYNTDVRHNDILFHVQTEDKGVANPLIESLVYVGGQVLASKRASYADLLAEGKDEKSVMAMMDHQHRTMIAAIRHGKFDDRVGEGHLDRSPAPVPLDGDAPAPPLRSAGTGPLVPPARLGTGPLVAPPPAAPSGARPAERGVERSLDQVILEYLTNEADQEQLFLSVEGDSDLAAGRRVELALRAQSSKSGQPVPGTQVSVRMISTVAEPRALAAGRTDERGAVALAFEIPALGRGTAALIITAVSPIGRAELKHLL